MDGGLGFVPATENQRYLAEFGVVFLMFSVGLEFSLPQLMAMRRIVFGLGLAQVAFTMLVVDANTFAFILPTQITVGMIAYSTGTFSVADYARAGWVTVLISVAYGFVFA